MPFESPQGKLFERQKAQGVVSTGGSKEIRRFAGNLWCLEDAVSS